MHRLNKRLETANEELETFAHTVSHDLHAPLRHMRYYAQFLMQSDSSTLSEKDRGYLERIFSSSEQMTRLIVDLLEFSPAMAWPSCASRF